MDLNFSISELIKSDTAKKYNINNTPDIKSIDNLLLLIFHILQPVRNKFGKIKVTSGFRSVALNQKVGGEIASNHLFGCAADIIPLESTFKKVYNYITTYLDYDECFIEQNKKTKTKWLHVAFRNGGNRKKHNSELLV